MVVLPPRGLEREEGSLVDTKWRKAVSAYRVRPLRNPYMAPANPPADDSQGISATTHDPLNLYLDCDS